jgi:hypothetical protein
MEEVLATYYVSLDSTAYALTIPPPSRNQFKSLSYESIYYDVDISSWQSDIRQMQIVKEYSRHCCFSFASFSPFRFIVVIIVEL